LLVKLHPYFSCCASCGEIRTPLDGRLCTSLAPDFPVDGVLPGATQQEAEAVQRAMPWLRRVHIAPGVAPVDTLRTLQTLPDLAGNFFVALAGSRLARIRHPLDLFTPNGIPLLAARGVSSLPPEEAAFCASLEERGLAAAREASFTSDVYALTRECLEGFLAFCVPLPGIAEAPDSLASLARWSYAVALAIPAGSAHPLLRDDS
jgi:hypothetical protein